MQPTSTDTQPWTVESLAGLSDAELNNIVFSLTDQKRFWGPNYTIALPSTDANAALLLLDEIAERNCDMKMLAVSAEGVETMNTFKIFDHFGFSDSIGAHGKPSAMWPRAITIAYILFKQENQQS